MDYLLDGLGDNHSFAVGEPLQGWTRPLGKEDARLRPVTTGGRRLIHPFLDDIVYPVLPSRTPNFDYDVLRKTRSVASRTMLGTGIAKYLDERDDVQISEVWEADDGISIPIGFFRLLYRYFTEGPMPPGNYIGWLPKDLSPYGYFVELLDLRLGSSDAYDVVELGSSEPFVLREPLTLTFKTIREARFPTGAMSFMGL